VNCNSLVRVVLVEANSRCDKRIDVRGDGLVKAGWAVKPHICPAPVINLARQG
jgi:hypothetical protein